MTTNRESTMTTTTNYEPPLYCEHCGRALTEYEALRAEDVNGEMWCVRCYVRHPLTATEEV